MTAYTTTETVVRRASFQVRSGRIVDDFTKAYSAAHEYWAEHAGTNPREANPVGWATVEVQDDMVAIVVTTEERPDAADRALKRVREAYAELVLRANTDSGGRPDGALDDTDLELIRKALDGEG